MEILPCKAEGTKSAPLRLVVPVMSSLRGRRLIDIDCTAEY